MGRLGKVEGFGAVRCNFLIFYLFFLLPFLLLFLFFKGDICLKLFERKLIFKGEIKVELKDFILRERGKKDIFKEKIGLIGI